MSKLGFTAMTLVGAVPAGFTLYLLVQHFVDHGVPSADVVGIAVWVSLAALFLVVITPFIVLIRYKGPEKIAAPVPAKGAKAEAAPAAKKKGKGESFDDAIPEDFDEEELKASQPEEEAYDEEEGGGDFDYDEDLEDFEEEEEEPKPKAKGKAKKK